MAMFSYYAMNHLSFSLSPSTACPFGPEQLPGGGLWQILYPGPGPEPVNTQTHTHSLTEKIQIVA